MYFLRITSYLTILNFFLLFYNFQVYNDWLPWYGWVVVIASGILLVHYVDKHYIWEDETTEGAAKNRILMENNRILKELKNQYEKNK